MMFNWFNNENYLSSKGQDQKVRSEKTQWARKGDDTKYILLGTIRKKSSWESQLLTPAVTEQPIKTTTHER